MLPLTRNRLLAATLLLALAGCDLFTGSGEADFSIALPAESFAPGAQIQVSVTNRSPRTLEYFSNCNQGFQRLVGEEWQDAYVGFCLAAVVEPLTGTRQRLSVAPIVPLAVEPGQSVELVYYVPVDAVAGQHRLRIALSDRDDWVVRISPVFVVESFALDASVATRERLQ